MPRICFSTTNPKGVVKLLAHILAHVLGARAAAALSVFGYVTNLAKREGGEERPMECSGGGGDYLKDP